MKRGMLRKEFVLAACMAGVCVFPGMISAQEDVDLPLDEVGAESIALADAGVEEADAQRLRTVREREDGEDVIEVEFSYENNAYEYVLRESDGMILEWSIEGRALEEAVAELTLTEDGIALLGEAVPEEGTQAEETQTEAEAALENAAGGASLDEAAGRWITVDGTELIGYERAKQIVLADSGIAPEDADFAKIKFEYDGRFYDYELELFAGRSEYEYKVDAQTGEIVEIEHD